jgi:hypothetical protein
MTLCLTPLVVLTTFGSALPHFAQPKSFIQSASFHERLLSNIGNSILKFTSRKNYISLSAVDHMMGDANMISGK